MSALRGKITGLRRYDIDGRAIEDGDALTATETVGLVMVADYVDGNLRDLVGHSLAIAPHADHQRELAKMHDQRAPRTHRAHFLEIDDNSSGGAPAKAAAGSEIDRLRAEVERVRGHLRKADAEVESLRARVVELERYERNAELCHANFHTNVCSHSLDYHRDGGRCTAGVDTDEGFVTCGCPGFVGAPSPE